MYFVIAIIPMVISDSVPVMMMSNAVTKQPVSPYSILPLLTMVCNVEQHESKNPMSAIARLIINKFGGFRKVQVNL